VNPSGLPPDELRGRAWSLAEPHFQHQRETARGRFGELRGKGRTFEALTDVVPAAEEGRIETLFLARGAREWGTYDSDRRRVTVLGEAARGHEDLLDRAAVQTLLHGGRVYVLEPGEPPLEEGPAAAILRY
jgi:hypothetical protein